MRPKEMSNQVREAVNHSIEKTKQKQRTFRSDQINKLVHFFLKIKGSIHWKS